MKYDGLPPLEPKPSRSRTVVFTNVKSVYLRSERAIREAFVAQSDDTTGVVVVRDGKVQCVGSATSACALSVRDAEEAQYIDLEGGSITPGLISAGGVFGISEIGQEEVTQDGTVADSLTESVPSLAGGSGALLRAADGLIFGTRDAL